MIIDAIITVIVSILAIFISIFPNANQTIITNITYYSTSFRLLMSAVDWIIPVSTLFTLFGYIFIIEFSLLTFKTIKYLASTVSGGLIKK